MYGYGGTTFYGDAAHDNQPAIMAAIAACEAAGSLVSEVGNNTTESAQSYAQLNFTTSQF